MAEKASWTPDDLSPQFWKTIDGASKDPEELERILRRMSREEIYEFYRQYEEARIALHDSQYLKPNMSDDDIDDIAMWAIAEGERTYRRIHDNPEEVPDELPSDQAIGYNDLAADIAEERFGHNLSDLYHGTIG